MEKKAIINGFKQVIMAKGPQGVYHNGQYMAREYSRFLETNRGRIDITSYSEAIKQALGRQRFPTESVMNKKLIGKVIDKGGDILMQLISHLK